MQSLVIVVALDELPDVQAKILKVLILFRVNLFLL